jgi:hypothetical protein
VDLVFGPQTLHRLPELIQQVRRNGTPVVDISFPEIEKFDRLPEPRAHGGSAFVSVMEGCSKYCSFCAVPYTRGEEISRPFDDVVAAGQGVFRLSDPGDDAGTIYCDADGGSSDGAIAVVEMPDLTLQSAVLGNYNVEFDGQRPHLPRPQTAHPLEPVGNGRNRTRRAVERAKQNRIGSHRDEIVAGGGNGQLERRVGRQAHMHEMPLTDLPLAGQILHRRSEDGIATAPRHRARIGDHCERPHLRCHLAEAGENPSAELALAVREIAKFDREPVRADGRNCCLDRQPGGLADPVVVEGREGLPVGATERGWQLAGEG